MSKVCYRYLLAISFMTILATAHSSYAELPLYPAPSTNNELPDEFFQDGFYSAVSKWLFRDGGSTGYLWDSTNYANGIPVAVKQLFAKDKWVLRKALNYNSGTGTYIPKVHDWVQVDQAPYLAEDMCVECIYFISKGPGTEAPLILNVYGSTLLAMYRVSENGLEENLSLELAKEFLADIQAELKSNNMYRGQVIEFANGMVSFLANVDDLKMTWDEFIFSSKVKPLIKQTIDGFINDYDEAKWSQYGLPLNRGVLLYGPPGTGKSFISKIISSNILNNRYKNKVTFVYVSARHMNSVDRVREVYQAARTLSPAVVFIEDIDLIAGTDRNDRPDIKNELMQQLSGIEELKGILTIGTTNYASRIDPALLRSKRLGYQFEIGLPSLDDRALLLKIYLGSSDFSQIEIIKWASQTEGFAGAAIKEFCEIAIELAMNDKSYSPDKKKVKVLDTHISRAYEQIKYLNVNNGK